MIFNDEQFAALAKYEDYFKDAVNAAWCRYPGHDALVEIHSILRAATTDRRRLNASCGNCNLNLIRDTGKLWLKDRQERIDKANEKKAVELSDTEAKPVKKSRQTGKKKKTE